ncbi:HNH endonuclease [Natronorubrum sp. JWXQ-INN-674]|uniref:HNH endonuclease n=1 Tax=Natronorubrum halalkaliphilum TaxID=2691917 RepID=A0A6B0VPK6_9EURY|nr:HNH endonuclease [Natronorubrum halalkaliphilum]MXV62469.1 HNH endonuclease [Natronorubrum halalkaliphilum]
MGTGADAGDRVDTRGYGEGWDELRRKTLCRDGYACRRCGADDRTLQAHHIVPRSAGGPDDLENLITVCRPCHGVIHQSNSSFDDVRDDAALFPRPDAPDPVARMREPSDGCCSRCGGEFEPAELVAWMDVPSTAGTNSTARESSVDHLTLCKPCAGFVLEHVPACDRDSLTGNHRVPIHELSARRLDAPVRPSVFAPSPVAVRREPRGPRERVVDDTPLRFLLNHRGMRWLTLLAIGYVVLFLLMGSMGPV